MINIEKYVIHVNKFCMVNSLGSGKSSYSLIFDTNYISFSVEKSLFCAKVKEILWFFGFSQAHI